MNLPAWVPRSSAALRPGLKTVIGIPLAMAVSTLGGAVAAQSTPLRDPTQPPPAYGAKPGGARDRTDSFKPEHLVIVDGERYLMWQGRRYRVGDSVRGERIERIDETEVWLRTREGVRKVPLFTGIERRPPAAKSASAEASEGQAQ